MKFEIENKEVMHSFVDVALDEIKGSEVSAKALLKTINVCSEVGSGSLPNLDEAIQIKCLMSEYIALAFYIAHMVDVRSDALALLSYTDDLTDNKFGDEYHDLYNYLRDVDIKKLNRRERNSYFNKVKAFGREVGRAIKDAKGECDGK